MSTPRTLQTSARQGSGSRAARKERAAGKVPVNVYGHGQGNVQVCVDAHELSLAFATTDQVFNLEIEGKAESCLVKDVQYDTYAQHVLHVDFTRIDLSEEVAVVVTLEFRGDPAGVKEGGVPVTHHPSLPIRCRADAIPESIVVDVAEVTIGHALHANELELPAGIKLDDGHIAEDEPIFGVAAPKVEVEEPAEGEEGAEGAEGAEGDAPAEGDGDKKDEGGDEG